jgi:sugar phosphate isomerase/epimerase
MPRIGLQLYTVRDHLAGDFAGTLAKVAEIGYEGVELAGIGGYSADDLWRLLDELGLAIAGTHIPLENLEKQLEAELDYYSALCTPLIVCPWVAPERRETPDDWRSLAESLNRIGAGCAERGIQFAYHHHQFEFVKVGRETGLDILMALTEPQLVRLELDTYWIAYAGLDVMDYLQFYIDRVSTIHMKDMADNPIRDFTEVGTGTIDLQAVVNYVAQYELDKEEEGMDPLWLLVEQDRCSRDSLESVRIGYRHMVHLLGVEEE